MYPTLGDIKDVLLEYEEPQKTIWAQWIHENWHNELPSLRRRVFQTTYLRLWNKRNDKPIMEEPWEMKA